MIPTGSACKFCQLQPYGRQDLDWVFHVSGVSVQLDSESDFGGPHPHLQKSTAHTFSYVLSIEISLRDMAVPDLAEGILRNSPLRYTTWNYRTLRGIFVNYRHLKMSRVVATREPGSLSLRVMPACHFQFQAVPQLITKIQR